jgi:cation diffusion facilitator family transporter
VCAGQLRVMPPQASRPQASRPPADPAAADLSTGGRPSASRPEATRATRRTVLVAGAANGFVFAVKLTAGILAGSSAMLAEAAHSLADTLDQAFLLTSVRQSERPPDRQHPFGYGQARYFWSLLAAFGIFIAGAGFSVFEGILGLQRGTGNHGVLPAYLALALSGAAEGISLVRAARQSRAQARDRGIPLLQHVRSSPDITVKTALFEDSAAIVGLLLALAGLVLRQVTGLEVFDAASSIAIGVLLVVIAVRLGAENRALLIGQAADPDQLAQIQAKIEHAPGIAALLDLDTMQLGPDHLIVAARVAFADDISADQAEDLADRIDAELARSLPVVPHVFLDPTTLRNGRHG